MADYLRSYDVENWEGILDYVREEIHSRLYNYPNFVGLDFSDVSAGGINIRGFHSQIEGYSYGKQPKIKYDFSNYEECIDEFVDMWIYYDTPEKVKAEQDFISAGEQYGWD